MMNRPAPRLLALLAAALAAVDQAAATTAAAQADPPPAARRSRGGADPSDDAFRFGSPPALPEGMTEEEMWPAATAEQWARPCLVHWQRSFEDALEVSRLTRRPILAAVNMDGEIASEHFAGVRYRDPATAATMNEYVCVVASVYRHTPRDHDPDGRRVPCPRFGTVTCGEHIQAERELYGRYLDGRRISPRHIVIEADGRETYDVFHSWDVVTVTRAVAAGLENRPEPLDLPEPTLENLVRGVESADRERLELLYRRSDRATKRRILGALAGEDAVDQVEVLRAGIFGLDLELASLAREALATCETEGALDLMAEALKSPLPEDERAVILEAVDRLAAGSPRARTLAHVHRGLAAPSPLIDADAVTARSAADDDGGASGWGEDPDGLLDLAEDLLTREGSAAPRYRALMLADAEAALDEARAAGEAGARTLALEALAARARGRAEAARRQAVAAMEAGLLAGDAAPLGPGTLHRVLRLFGSARCRAIRAAYRERADWDPTWLADVRETFMLLAASERMDLPTALEYHDFFRWIGATAGANRVLDAALERFPSAPALHQRLRERLLWERGPDALEAAYGERLAGLTLAEEDPGRLHWFAGFASMVAAEQHRRRSRFPEAEASYGRALERFGRDAELHPELADDPRHYMALARAGRARVAMERGELDRAAAELGASLRLRPASASSLDGLGISPVATARMIEARLRAAGDDAGAAAVRAALDGLDPALVAPPPSEAAGSARNRRGR